MRTRKALVIGGVFLCLAYSVTLMSIVSEGLRDFGDIYSRGRPADLWQHNADYRAFVDRSVSHLAKLLVSASFLLNLGAGLLAGLPMLIVIGLLPTPVLLNRLPYVHFPGDSFNVSFFFMFSLAKFTALMLLATVLVKVLVVRVHRQRA